MRIILALWIALLGVGAAQAEPPHYDVAARFDPAGILDADVTITLSEAQAEKAFLLSQRFTLRPMALPKGVTMTVEPSDTPMPALNKYVFRFARPDAAPVKLRFRYAGPILTENDSGNKPLRPEGYELFIDHMWFPVGADVQTRFTVDATIDGLAADLVVVAQGEVTRTPTGVRIKRDFIDIDLPMVAMRGLERAEAHGVEFYSRDLSTRLSGWYVKHAEGAARYFEAMYGPLPRKVRMAQVWRERSMGYARTAYTVLSEAGRNTADVTEVSPARYVAHEVGHAWWMLASPLTDDFWLVESAAEYMSMRYVEHAFGAEELAKNIAAKREATVKAGPVMGHGRPDRLQLYGKGPLLLVDLEHRIGRPAMDRLMIAMAKEPVHTTSIFLGHLTRIAGADAARAFETALHT
ncbi:hypothetical protein ASE06_07285 [Sphingopyxis sp. Root214]|uniref:hypothetical protein n=1 Tax=unclassified Sphingopyxis TaxID=2614943 RepID=UPI000702307A|nr:MULTISPECIES: hypothetical protein [unclassified Sphingopyxis]KQZ76480.1 hypothetical protein ASD73_00710 [Sphingopyxis sp. Root154]KRC09633.1 hypothetical protein ASE06_07285 [Sphingopyxis sp. Root214]